MLLYRFLNLDHSLQLLQDQEWKVSRLLQLNDPADCVPTLVGGPSLPTQAAQKVFALNYLKEMYQNIGMVCFSANVTDPVIWSHYADAHRGMAIGFEMQVPSPMVHEVKYQEDRPVLKFEELEKLKEKKALTNEFLRLVIGDAFTRKAPSWAYEREYRIFLFLRGCKMKGRHYFEAFTNRPAKIILGTRCPINRSDVIRIYGQSRRRLNNSQIGRAIFDLDRYTLIIRYPQDSSLDDPPTAGFEAPESDNEDGTATTGLGGIP